jgi:hypothetical protein
MNLEDTGVARIRSIKPEFWSSEQVMSCSFHSRLFFIGLWTFCDDGGVHPLKPITLKALIFPGDSIDSDSIRRMLDELSDIGLIDLYQVDGKEYLQVSGWSHQRIDKPTIKFPSKEMGTPIKSGTSQKKFDESSSKSRRGIGEESDTDRSPSKAIPQITRKNIEDMFNTFWKLYPRKVGKAAALKKFETKCKTPDEFDAIIAGLGQHIKHVFNLTDPQYIPHAITWLNQERWKDEVTPNAGPNTTGPFAGTAGTRRPSLVDQVRIRGEQLEAERHASSGRQAAVDAELCPAGMDPGRWEQDFASIDELDGSLVAVDDRVIRTQVD